MKFIYFLFFTFIIVKANAENLVEYDYEIDAYYSNVSAFIDLEPDKEITNAINMSERDIYTHLFLHTFEPNIMLFEVSVHPMGIAGLYFRSKHDSLYNESSLDNFNIVKAVTAGYEEPYSFSFFIGRMMVFQNNIDDKIGKNRAYLGTLLTVGDYSIKDNVAHYDKWLNIEYKLKGTRIKEDSDLDWSFRLGMKLHENRDFSNTIYIGARRKSVDYKKTSLSFVYNSAFSTMLAISEDTYRLTDAEIILEKSWPISWTEKLSFGLGIGYLFTSGEKYNGKLRDEGINNHQLIFRPNITW